MKAIVLFLSVILLLVALSQEQDCNINAADLKALRLETLQLYANRYDGANITRYYEIVNQVLDPNTTITIRGVGSFSPKTIAIEYGLQVLPVPGIPAVVTFVQSIDNSTLVYSGDVFTYTSNGEYNFTDTSGTLYVIGGLRNKVRITFTPCSALILGDYSIQDSAIIPFERSPALLPSVETLCGGIMQVCTGSLQQYSSITDCIQFISSLNSPCPEPLDSSTLSCRVLHLRSALIDPVTHCPHTGKNSSYCYDRCLPQCADCTSNNATCAVSYSGFEDAEYFCQCNDGFVGNGSTCTAKYCNDTLCTCPPTFIWDPTTGGCVCPEQTELKDGNICIPLGNCLDISDCAADRFTAQCIPTDPPNSLSPFNACLCNPGFTGGWELPCQCGGSVLMNGSSAICASAGACLSDNDCNQGQTCEVVGGGMGNCRNPPVCSTSSSPSPSPSPSCAAGSDDDDDGTVINFYFADILRA